MTYINHVSIGGQWVQREPVADEYVFAGGQWVPGQAETIVVPEPLLSLDEIAGLSFYLDAADPSGTGSVPDEGAKVTTWRDKIGNRSLTVLNKVDGTPNLDAAPTWRAGSGTPHLRFDGQNDALTYSGAVIPTTGAYTIYAVTRAGQRGYGTLFWQGSSSSATPFYGFDYIDEGRLRSVRRTDDNVLTSSSTAVEPNTWVVTSAVSSGPQNQSLRVHEKVAPVGTNTANTAGVTTTNVTSIGNRISYSNSYIGAYGRNWTGDLAAFVVYEGAHDATTRIRVERFLATEYKQLLPSQGGTTLDAAAVLADRTLWSREYGVPATHAVTGKALPGFHNTGPAIGTAFTDFTGTFTTSSANQVVRNMRINGAVKVNHEGVEFRDCVIYSTLDPKVDTRTTTPLVTPPVFRRCEIYGQLNDSGTALGYIRYTAIDCFIHDSEDGARLNKQTRIERCFIAIHSDGYLTSTERLHTDCVQSNGGDNDPGVYSEVLDSTLIAQRHNGTKGNSAVILATEGAMVNGVNQGSPLRRVRINGNYMAGGSYTLYIKTPGTNGSPGAMEDFTISNNVFRGVGSGGAYALYGDMWLPYASLANTFLTLSGNVREDGAALQVSRSTPGGAEAD